jgi:hypothetical protein
MTDDEDDVITLEEAIRAAASHVIGGAEWLVQNVCSSVAIVS